MGFLDRLKFWKRTPAPAAPSTPAEVATAPEPPPTVEVDGLLAALAEREAENRRAALATDSFHQRDKHNDRADEDAWIIAKIREAM
jgi:hypothetical protein